MRILVQFWDTSIGSTLAFVVPSENMYDTVLNLLSNRKEIHVFATSGRTFNLQVITVVLVESLQTLNKYKVGCKLKKGKTNVNLILKSTQGCTFPDRTTPVRVSSKHSRVRVTRPVVNFVSLSPDFHTPWLVLVLLRKSVRV